MSRRAVVLGVVVLSFTWLAGCQQPKEILQSYQPPKKDYGRPLPPGALALRKIGPEAYPDFGRGFVNRAGLEQAIRNSLDYLAKPSSERYFPYGDISHARAVASLERFLEVLQTAPTAQALHQAVCAEFDVYQSVGCDDRGTVYFTGYYTPIFPGRRTRDEQFRYPLYRLPDESSGSAYILVKDEEGHTLGQRRDDGGINPNYPTRRQIEEGRLLDGREIAWVRGPFEAYVITVQGSAKLHLEDGSLYELGYAGNNGHDYVPIAEAMIQDGVIRRGELSLQTLIAYFAEHPEQVYHYAWKNPRYVFFQERAGAVYGSLNEPVTPFRSIATDKQVFPRACLAFLTADLPMFSNDQVVAQPYATFACDQDTGGAIRAAGRSDIYMGVGARAGALAGRTGSEGALYYIFVKQGARTGFARSW